eukprot:g81811.t1
MYGVLPPASLQFDLEGKLLPDAQTYPDLLRKMIKENREKEQKERKRREDEGLAEERVGGQLPAPTMDELREHKGWTVAVMDGNHLLFYELADEKDPRWESSSIQLGEGPAHVLLCWPDPKVLTVYESLAKAHYPARKIKTELSEKIWKLDPKWSKRGDAVWLDLADITYVFRGMARNTNIY